MLNREQTEQALRAAVAERGREYVYTKPDGADDCQYLHGDQPGCGVGLVMIRNGVSRHALRNCEGDRATSVARDLEFADRSGAELLSRFQSWQDTGWSWGESLDRALRDENNGDSITPDQENRES